MSRPRLPPGFSFSLSRAVGLTKAKRQLVDKIGVPLTEAGRQRKAGAAMGCCVVLAVPMVGVGLTAITVWETMK